MGMRHAAVVAGLALGLASGAAEAAPLEFYFSGDIAGSDHITFDTVLDSSPDMVDNVGGIYFQIDNIKFDATDVNSDPFTFTGSLEFGAGFVGGGLQLLDSNQSLVLGAYGAPLFTGSLDQPTFRTGSFELSGEFYPELNNNQSGVPLEGTLRISTVPLPAPAPMFGAALLALGAAGYAARRNKDAVTA